MNKLALLFLVLILGVSCASHEAKKDVKEEAAEILPVINPTAQYDRAVAMVEANPDLSQEQKTKLTGLIKSYGTKAYENRKKESQYRVVLLEEMMKSDAETTETISAAKKDITNLNKENSKLLEGFVNDFKSTIGKSAKFNQPVMMEVILVE
jgi:hypothetical protein